MSPSYRVGKTLAALSWFVSVIAFAPLAIAQYIGPSTTPTHKTVADILKDPIDDHPVVLDGHLVKKVGNEKYLFSDGSAEIRVEIDREHFPSTPITEKTKVRIRGELENDFLQSPEIDVDYLAVIQEAGNVGQ